MQVVRVSGTIKKAEEEAIRRAKAAILKAKDGTDQDGSIGLDAILGKADEVPSISHSEGRGRAAVDIEDDDEDDEGDEETEDSLDENA